MNSTKIYPKPASSRYLITLCVGVLALLGLLHAFMTTYVLPHFEGFLDVYLPSRNGGKSFFMHADWFVMFSSIVIAAMAVVTILVAILARRNRQVASALTMAVVVLSGIFLATFIGNAFYQLWGTWPSVLSVIVLILGLFVAEYPLIASLADPHSRFVKK